MNCIQSIIDMNAKVYGLIIKYEVYGHNAIMFELHLEVVFELEYDFVKC